MDFKNAFRALTGKPTDKEAALNDAIEVRTCELTKNLKGSFQQYCESEIKIENLETELSRTRDIVCKKVVELQDRRNKVKDLKRIIALKEEKRIC